MRRLLCVLVALWICAGFAGRALAGGPPNAPSNLHEAGPIAHLEWTYDSSDEDGFRVMRQVQGQQLVVAGTFPANTTTSPYLPGTLEEQCHYPKLWVVAFNSFGESAPSNSIAVLIPPSGCRDTFRRTFTNETSVIADHLFVPSWSVSLVSVETNAPGCSEPVVDAYGIAITWPAPCVDPGERILVKFDQISPNYLGDPAWSVVTTPTPTIEPTAVATSTPAATPAGLPQAGGPPASRGSWLFAILVSLATIAAGTLALKRIR